MMKTVKIGTRGSRLALIQADMVINAIQSKLPNVKCEKVIIKTEGDKNQSTPLEQFGGKAVFVDEFEKMLTLGKIDFAVHSAKDMPNELPNGLEIGAVLPRGDVRDVLLYKKETKEIKTVGTSSKRRTVQTENLYPNARCLPLRGNVTTRVQKLKSGQFDAVVLAKAGLDRLGIFGVDSSLVYDVLPIEKMLPAACQGIIAVENRTGEFKSVLSAINDKETMTALNHERQIMNLLDADCKGAVGALEIDGEVHVMKKFDSELKYCTYGEFDLEEIKKDFV